MIRVKEREIVFGKETTFPSFGWDVEYGSAHLE